MKPHSLAPGQIKLLRGLRDAGGSGVFDRWVRVVAGGEVLTTSGSTTALTAFRYWWIRMADGRVEITPAGLAVLEKPSDVLARAIKDGRWETENPAEKERAVLVTTVHRGVFFGYATDTTGDVIELRRARCCLFWPPENRGFLGLAAEGPLEGSRVGPAADIELRDVTCVAKCTPAAVERWEAAPWR